MAVMECLEADAWCFVAVTFAASHGEAQFFYLLTYHENVMVQTHKLDIFVIMGKEGMC